MPRLALLSLLPAAAALVLPRQYVPPNACCFTLHDASTSQVVRQDTRSGLLYLDGAQPTGWYCIDLSDQNKVLRDAFNNACFVNPDRAFQCLDPTPGMDSWAVEQSGADVLLVVNRDSNFKKCPSGSGSVIFSSAKNDAGCRGLRLKAQGLQGTCGSFRG